MILSIYITLAALGFILFLLGLFIINGQKFELGITFLSLAMVIFFSLAITSMKIEQTFCDNQVLNTTGFDNVVYNNTYTNVTFNNTIFNADTINNNFFGINDTTGFVLYENNPLNIEDPDLGISARNISLNSGNKNDTPLNIKGSFQQESGVLPNTIPNLNAWYDANNSAEMTIVNGNVSIWGDVQGTANYDMREDNVSRRPRFIQDCVNGQACVHFDGVWGGLTTTTSGAMASKTGSPFTWTAIIQINRSVSIGDFTIVGAIRENNGQGSGLYQSGTRLCGRADQSGTQTVICSASQAISSWHLVTYQGTTGNIRLYVDGPLISTNLDTIQNWGAVDYMAIPYNRINLINNRWNGNLAEVLFYTRDITDLERENMEAKLCVKYNLTCTHSINFQQENYATILDGRGGTVFNITKTGSIWSTAGAIFNGAVQIFGALSFTKPPFSITVDQNENAIYIDHNSGEGGRGIEITTNGNGFRFVYIHTDAGSNLWEFGCNFGRCSMTFGDIGFGVFNNASVWNVITSADVLGAAFQLKGKEDILYCGGSGYCRFTHEAFAQFDIGNLIYQIYNVVVDGDLWMEKDNDKIVFGSGQNKSIYSNATHLIINATNTEVTGNITAENVFLPQYIFPHTNITILVNGANQWTNITFDQEVTTIKQGIEHTATDNTNTTFTINADGIYYISYDLDVIDTSASATVIDFAGRLTYINGSEIDGSLFEQDITRVEVETSLYHDFLAELRVGDKLIFQFIADDADVEISTHSTFGDHPDSASIIIKKIANLPS